MRDIGLQVPAHIQGRFKLRGARGKLLFLSFRMLECFCRVLQPSMFGAQPVQFARSCQDA